MSAIKVHDKYFVPYLSENEIQQKIQQLALQLSNDYKHAKPLFIAILNGSFMFAADLFKYLNIDAKICLINLASYKETKSTVNVFTAIGLNMTITKRHILILENIIDTEKTLNHFFHNCVTSNRPL